MELLWPERDLTAIAVEGPSPSDQPDASVEALEVADLTLYYGACRYESARRVTISQFKYSVARSSAPFRAAHAKSTLTKFAAVYKDRRTRLGRKAVAKLDFEFVTNRPIYPPLLDALDSLARGLPSGGEVAKQAQQVAAASGLDGRALADFAGKCAFLGPAEGLARSKHDLAALLVDWSATHDTQARARLGNLREMVRDKAGSGGEPDNLIQQTDVLAALEVSDADDLLPCRPALPEVGRVVQREQFDDTLALIPELKAPLLIHAAGGVGKTVFMTNLARALGEQCQVVFFDCFGGGAYRSPEDARHLPTRGLIHIANTLAFGGLCDPILPGGNDLPTLLRTFRRRLEQCVANLKKAPPDREVVLFLDAIDNAVLVARERSDDAFPLLLLESLGRSPIPGVTLVVSCRSENRPSIHPPYKELELRPFSLEETGAYLRPRIKGVSPVAVKVAQARSGGNPRVLEYLVTSGRGVLDESEIDETVALDDLLQERLASALAAAHDRGHAEEDIKAFLAGLAVLPPPVPLEEYAGTHDLALSAVESFASDLSPLLERTSHGLIFRDEPTETLVRNQYASSSTDSLRRLATSLEARQDVSVYAARSLPGLLHSLDDGERLFRLAFDERIPAAITSTVGKRNVRYARLKAAVLHAALKNDFNRLVHLLTELASVAAVDQRGVQYILDNPDLVVAAQDADATRRLFEARTSWPGTRHARLAIAHALAGASEEATRHALRAEDWIYYFVRQEGRDRHRSPQDSRPEQPDIAAVAFVRLSEARPSDAVTFLGHWRDWYAHEVGERLFQYVQLATAFGQGVSARTLAIFVDSLRAAGALTAALSFHTLPPRQQRKLLARLAYVCRYKARVSLPETSHRERPYDIFDGLRVAATRAVALGLPAEALTISARTRHQSPSLWALRNHFFQGDDVFPFVFYVALRAVTTHEELHEKDLVPRDLVPICARMSKRLSGDDFRRKLRARLPQFRRKETDPVGTSSTAASLSADDIPRAERFLDQQLEPLLRFTRTFRDLLAASRRRSDSAFRVLLDTWEETRKNTDRYDSEQFDPLFRALGFEAAVFALRVLPTLKVTSVRRFLALANSQGTIPSSLVRIAAVLAQRPALHDLAGEVAVQARAAIEAENDVALRASLLGDLARAMLPASVHDATVYFRHGLDQLDAIGSDDLDFTSELLTLTASLKGAELDPGAFHVLTNICELNLPEEVEKFMWGAFARALSKAAGPRVLAKLSRWDDRGKIDLEYSLLPCLIALVADGKLEPEVALALNRLAKPVDYWYDGSKQFAEVLHRRVGTARPDIVSELIGQHEDDHRGGLSDWTLEVLAPMAADTFGASAGTSRYLVAAQRRFAALRDTRNDHANYRNTTADPKLLRRADTEAKQDRAALEVTAAHTDPTDFTAISQALGELGALQRPYGLKNALLAALRSRVPLGGRAQYIQNVCALEGFNLSWKLDELKECKSQWASSTAALGDVLKSQAKSLVRLHVDDLISFGTLSGLRLSELAELTGIPVGELVLELIPALVRSDTPVPGGVWLGTASFVTAEADAGQGQAALTRLLQSDAATLTNRVVDGPWKEGLYPEGDAQEIAAALVWRALGSPHTEARWRAAHSLRTFARFGRWTIGDRLVAKLESEETAGPFQASELVFYYLHARLWLLIALARLALDYPKEIARYRTSLLVMATEEVKPHVLMRHFAARALLTCVNAGALTLPAALLTRLRTVDCSPHARIREKVRKGNGFYGGRPDTAPKPPHDFDLDMDFGKNDADGLGRVFGKMYWEVEDMMAEIVHGLDPKIGSMYDKGGRESGFGERSTGMTDDYHTHGQQLGWHALFFAAGTLLRDVPVTDDSWYDDPWPEWFSRYLLTREDGYWLSDGMDRLPLDTAVTLLEKTKDGLALTGDRDKILALVGIAPRVGKELVVDGTWYSDDNIQVHISSALVDPRKAERLARRLTREEPIRVWLPKYFESEDGTEYLQAEKKGYAPWIHIPEREVRLDATDPFGASCANVRPSASDEYAKAFSLAAGDRFRRMWEDKHGRIVVRAEAWGRENKRSDSGAHSGLRLLCATSFLRTFLRKYDKELVVLIYLQRYQSESYRSRSSFTHTIAVVRVSRQLAFEYVRGRINHKFVPK